MSVRYNTGLDAEVKAVSRAAVSHVLLSKFCSYRLYDQVNCRVASVFLSNARVLVECLREPLIRRYSYSTLDTFVIFNFEVYINRMLWKSSW
jgi:RNase P subunit RPR2